VRQLDERARALGAADHRLVEARPEFFDKVIKYLIMGNVRRGNMYPLCVGAERGLQAKYLAQLATELGSDTVAHGCTAAGNDQVRFEIVLKAVAPQLTILAPVRDHAWQRPAQVKFLEERKMPVPTRGSAYSTNRGLWGVTIGGTETLDSKGIPESAWVLSAGALTTQPLARLVEFERGVPSVRRRLFSSPYREARGGARSGIGRASTWATRSSARRAVWRSRPRPPRS
jgi:argininosuccinate synthase